MTDLAAEVRPDPDAPQPPPESGETQAQPLPRWKKILLVSAGALVLAGLAMLPFQASGDLSTSQSGPGSAVGQSLDGGQSFGADGPAAGSAEGENLAPTFLKLGFSFFVGFAVGYAFRAFLKLALIVVGIQLLMLFGLQWLDWVTVNWEMMGSAWDGFVGKLGTQFESIRSFITGSLPQASLGGLGLVAGFKRN